MLLEVKQLRTHFYTKHGVVKAVDGVSYDLDEGEMVGIVGESGSGKSVGVLSLIKLIEPPGRIIGGDIMFGEKNLLDLSEERIRAIRGAEIAMIFQEPLSSLNPVLTIGRQISEAMEIHLGLGHKKALARSLELLKIVGIPGGEQKINSYPHELSGGMRQRVMIAMALSCNPKIIIADEPTSALDVTIAADILDLLKSLTVDHRVSVILVTHDLGIVARYVDRVIVMYSGRIVEYAPVMQIFAHPAHPYTIGLLNSVPHLPDSKGKIPVSMAGSPPDPTMSQTGCAFYPRCDYTDERCRTKSPDLTYVSPQHSAACWNLRGGN